MRQATQRVEWCQRLVAEDARRLIFGAHGGYVSLGALSPRSRWRGIGGA